MWLKPDFAKVLLLTGLLLSALAYGGDGVSTMLANETGVVPHSDGPVSARSKVNSRALDCRITGA